MIVGKDALRVWADRIRLHIHNLIERMESDGTRITLDAFRDMRMNSFEGAALRPYLDDEALAWFIEHCAANCQVNRREPPLVYDEQLANVLAPLAAGRLRELHEIRRSSDRVGAVLAEHGYGLEADGRAPAAPALVDVPGIVEYLAREVKRLADRIESLEHDLDLIAEDIDTDRSAVIVGKVQPKDWKRLPGLAYQHDLGGVVLKWERDGKRWRRKVVGFGDGSWEPDPTGAPWYDPPFEWAVP
jgi:hypothetical protein